MSSRWKRCFGPIRSRLSYNETRAEFPPISISFALDQWKNSGLTEKKAPRGCVILSTFWGNLVDNLLCLCTYLDWVNFSRIYLNKLQVEEGPEAGLCAAAWKKTCPSSQKSHKQKQKSQKLVHCQFPETEDANKSFALVALELNALATIDTLNFYNSRQKMCSILAE